MNTAFQIDWVRQGLKSGTRLRTAVSGDWQQITVENQSYAQQLAKVYRGAWLVSRVLVLGLKVLLRTVHRQAIGLSPPLDSLHEQYRFNSSFGQPFMSNRVKSSIGLPSRAIRVQLHLWTAPQEQQGFNSSFEQPLTSNKGSIPPLESPSRAGRVHFLLWTAPHEKGKSTLSPLDCSSQDNAKRIDRSWPLYFYLEYIFFKAEI